MKEASQLGRPTKGLTLDVMGWSAAKPVAFGQTAIDEAHGKALFRWTMELQEPALPAPTHPVQKSTDRHFAEIATHFHVVSHG